MISDLFIYSTHVLYKGEALIYIYIYIYIYIWYSITYLIYLVCIIFIFDKGFKLNLVGEFYYLYLILLKNLDLIFFI